MPSHDRDQSSPAPSRTALRSLPYALPIALGLVCLTWSLTDLVVTFTDSYWVVVELLPGLLVLTASAGLLVFGGVGALACVERATDTS